MNLLSRIYSRLGRLIVALCNIASAYIVLTAPLQAQTTNVSGIINLYTRAVLIDYCNASIVVRNPSGFIAGDKILVIQAKGADIDATNDPSFGDIDDYHGAGNYEIATVDEVNGATLVLHHMLARDYDLSGTVQVIRIPQYVNVNVSGMLTAKPWDGETGGVLAFIATGTVTMNADINVQGKGFRGAVYEKYVGVIADAIDFYYDGESDSGSYKGEGITEFTLQLRSGRGKLANGGGGGNTRGSGGGGGGNGGNGGQGGYQIINLGSTDIGGLGGTALSYSNVQNKVFFGGAGGSSGYEDVEYPVAGAAGGGVVLIQASTIQGNGRTIEASGVHNILGDNNGNVIGGGGGGAGGVVLLDVATFTSTLTINVNGGKGSNAEDISVCYGPGGGGGGGCIWFSLGGQPLGVTNNVVKGSAGSATGGVLSCFGTSYGAGNGADGIVLTGLQIPTGTILR